MNTINKIELKNIKYAAFASDDSHCFEATVYLNGKRMIACSDDGNGGMVSTFPLKNQSEEQYRTNYQAVMSAVWDIMLKEDKRQLIKSCMMFLHSQGDSSIPSDYYQYDEQQTAKYEWTIKAAEECKVSVVYVDFECIASNLVTDFLIANDLKKALRTHWLFLKDTGGIFEIKRRKGQTVEVVEPAIIARHPSAKVLNAMPFDKALEIWKAA